MTEPAALRVISLESRRGTEMARLLARHGVTAIEAPSMREVPLEGQGEALAFGDALMRGECDLLVLLTGVGLRALVGALATRWPETEVVAALGRTQLACRGPKPVAVLKELGLKPAITAPEPNTFRELLSALETVDLKGRRVWVQEYGRKNTELLGALAARGAEVHSAAVYAWELPEDIAPLERAIEQLCDGAADAVMFTSAQQLQHLLRVAERKGRRDALLDALRSRVVIASIGPVTSEALAEQGLRADLTPEHPKMGHLVKAFVERGAAVLAAKRGAPAR